MLSALAESLSQWSLLASWLGVSVVLQHVGGCSSVHTTSAKVCRGAWLANLKYTMFAFFLLTVQRN